MTLIASSGLPSSPKTGAALMRTHRSAGSPRRRDRAEGPAARAERRDDRGAHAQRAQEAEVLVVRREGAKGRVVDGLVDTGASLADHRRRTLGPAEIEGVAHHQVPRDALPLGIPVHGCHLADALALAAQEDEAPVGELAGDQPRHLYRHDVRVQRPLCDLTDAGDQAVTPAG